VYFSSYAASLQHASYQYHDLTSRQDLNLDALLFICNNNNHFRAQVYGCKEPGTIAVLCLLFRNKQMGKRSRMAVLTVPLGHALSPHSC
jgi:hypothetical protein